MKQWVNGAEVELDFDEQGRIDRVRKYDVKKEVQIEHFKELLAATDYITNKIVEGESTVDDYKELIEQRKFWRAKVRELERLS